MSNYFLFRYRRSARVLRRWSRSWHKRTTAYVNQHLWGKWHQLRLVRRFMLGWWLVLIVAVFGLGHQLAALGKANLVPVPVSGGTFTQAAVGTVKVLNPILPESSPATDINRLIFSGLTKYGDHRDLQPDLATGWQVSPDGRTYTFKIRHGVTWQDGVPFTSTDVAFTVAAIQNPDSRSPLASSWQGVTVATPDESTVTFTLPAPLNSFLDSTTLGIVPRHLLEQVDPSSLREADFNRHPVGTGPFELGTFAPSADEVELVANPKYYLGKPKLDGFNFHFYDSEAEALTAYAQHQVTSPGQITTEELAKASKLHRLTQYQMSLPEETTLFFNTTDPVLKDIQLRSILTSAIDREGLINSALSGNAVALTQPLLPGEIGYTDKYAPTLTDTKATMAALDAAGWKLEIGSSVRRKDGQALALNVVTVADSQLATDAQALQAQLAPAGIKLNIKTVELDELQQTYMRPRNFQMLLFGTNIGPDPDVYAFWHSSQAKDPGVNLSQYSSATADAALESGRIKSDPAIREAKYDAFLKAWNTDAPSAVLYQTQYIYGVADSAMGITARQLVTPSDRFNNVQNWTVRQKYQIGR
ncbi:peptide ABC transporter substrate-binding protein [Candidatus Saccharibacteria bacterium]|nr:peptide ABC transporter substrate-binding protein [Candidatus Saccharibacteria bacterium]